MINELISKESSYELIKFPRKYNCLQAFVATLKTQASSYLNSHRGT